MPTIVKPRTGVRMAADIGGTFTDVVLESPQGRLSCKVLTTVLAPEVGVLRGVSRLLADSGIPPGDVELFLHGTTLATNALIERKGAVTALLTTQGFRDVLAMGHEKRFDAYDVNIQRPPELVPRPLRFTVPERVDATGAILVPLDETAVIHAAHRMLAAGVESVAVGFLHAWVHAGHEQRAREILERETGGRLSICLSSEVCPEMREYERFSTTAANAYVRPIMAGYLHRLQQGLNDDGLDCPVLLMMSGGGLTTLEQAARFPIRLVESGPAGGAILAAHLARECGIDDVVAFDMGGTTAKICLIADGEPERSRSFEVARAWRNLKGSGLPLRIPVIELVEIGAGGGSIGRVDPLSRITVGPDSCGSEPGPACYGRGGEQPAVTDANLVLGRLDPARFAAGQLHLDEARARSALLDHVGAALQLDAFWAAAGISEIVEENMANAARVHAVERGQDLAGFTMIAFGGAAPLHAGRLAQKLGVRRIVVPAGAGVGSAIGFLRAPIAYEVVRSDAMPLAQCDPATIALLLSTMSDEARAVVSPAAGDAPLVQTALAELRFVGQGHTLRVRLPWGDRPIDRALLDALAAEFEDGYEKAYGIRLPGSTVEVVAWSVTLSTGPAPIIPAQLRNATQDAFPAGRRDAWEPGKARVMPFGVYRRDALEPTHRVSGPALIAEDETTTVVPAGWGACVDTSGHLHLEADSHD